MSKFTIDFFELQFLAKACIPPAPIARTVFLSKLVNEYFDLMSEEERERFYVYIKPMLDPENCYHLEVLNRYDGNNQYLVTVRYDDKIENYRCFKIGDDYHINNAVSLQDQYIKVVRQVFPYDKNSK